MVVSATISSSPTMIYFGQEVGEPGEIDGGFGKASRTSIFDYVGVPNHQRWMNGGKFDGGQLSKSEKDLREFYRRLLNFTINSDALTGKFQEIQTVNRDASKDYSPGMYSFVRWTAKEKLIVVANFSWVTTSDFDLKIPQDVINSFGLGDGLYEVEDQLSGNKGQLKVTDGKGSIQMTVNPSESYIYKIMK